MTVKVLDKELEGYTRDRDWYRELVRGLEQNPTEETHLYLPPARAVAERFDQVITAARNGDALIAGHRIASEIFAAMDLPWYMLLQTAFLGSAASTMTDHIDESERIGLGTDMCTAVRMSIEHIEAGLQPPPTAITSPLQPCDAAPLLYQILSRNERWRDIPHFGFDPPYWEDERGIEYFAQEFREMVAFLEKHTGRKLDLDRLREVIQESNKQYEMWIEYNDLRRAVPCPHGFGLGGMQCFAVTQMYLTGDPRGTAWYRDLIAHAEKRIQEGKGGMATDERIRVFWFDIMPMGWIFEFMSWLEQEWGGNIVMDMLSYAPYDTIDTSTEESIFRGLAKRSLTDMPMVRQARGVADLFLEDIVRIVEDYKMDCVIWPGHMGHKDGSASVGMMREMCREIGVPFLHIGLDLFDPRYTTVDQVKGKMSQFFTAIGLG